MQQRPGSPQESFTYIGADDLVWTVAANGSYSVAAGGAIWFSQTGCVGDAYGTFPDVASNLPFVAGSGDPYGAAIAYLQTSATLW